MNRLKQSRIARIHRMLERRERGLRAEIRCFACEPRHEKTHVHEGTPTF